MPALACASSEADVSPVQTPTKTAPGTNGPGRGGGGDSVRESLTEKHPWGPLEVKNTFIHMSSPLKTISVVSPPKTVPSNFAPEYVLFDSKPLTPLAGPHASTPSTSGCTHMGGGNSAGAIVGLSSGQQQGGATGTLLRLSDFLPFPAATMEQPAAPQASQCDTSNWQGFEMQTLMPPVPPLPGAPIGCSNGVLSPISSTGPLSPFGTSGSSGALSPFGTSGIACAFDAMGYSPQGQDIPTGVAAAAVPGAACTAGTSVAVSFDGTPMQCMAGDMVSLMNGGGMNFTTAALGLEESVQSAMQSPTVQLDEQDPFHLGGASTQIGAVTSYGGAMCSGPGVTSGSSQFSDAALLRRVNISAGHFPEPGAAMASSAQLQQQSQLPSQQQSQLQPPAQALQLAQQQPQQQPVQQEALPQQQQPPPEKQQQQPQVQSQHSATPTSHSTKWRSSPSKSWRKRGGHGGH